MSWEEFLTTVQIVAALITVVGLVLAGYYNSKSRKILYTIIDSQAREIDGLRQSLDTCQKMLKVVEDRANAPYVKRLHDGPT